MTNHNVRIDGLILTEIAVYCNDMENQSLAFASITYRLDSSASSADRHGVCMAALEQQENCVTSLQSWLGDRLGKNVA